MAEQIIKNNPLISIIVPIYKVEHYLNRCIESLINQTYKNIEILLIDDGSPDSCPKMCDDWAMKDSRIKVFHKQNGGLSDARNYGTENASGEYITYVDSDDYVKPIYIYRLYAMLEKNGADIACCSYIPIESEEKNESETKEYDIYLMNGQKACIQLFTEHKVSTMAWSKLYKKNVLTKFPKGRNYEDTATVCKVLYKANLVAASYLPIYYVNCSNSNSICHIKSLKNLDDSIWADMERARFFSSVNEKELAVYAWNYAGGDMINIFIEYPHYVKSWRKYYKEFLNESDASFFLKMKISISFYFPRIYKVLKSRKNK